MNFKPRRDGLLHDFERPLLPKLRSAGKFHLVVAFHHHSVHPVNTVKLNRSKLCNKIISHTNNKIVILEPISNQYYSNIINNQNFRNLSIINTLKTNQ